MATIDRIQPSYPHRRSSTAPSAAPSTSGVADTDPYRGRHRRGTNRVFSWRRMFYTARHRRR